MNRISGLIVLALALVGCDSGHPRHERGGNPIAEAGEIVVTRSGSDTVAATLNGGSQNVLITFSARDERKVDSLSVMSGLSSLPVGWSGPGVFQCTEITQQSSCTLALTYTPTTIAEGSISLEYQYYSSGGSPTREMVEFAYAATANNNVVSTTVPMGQVLAVVGGRQAVRVSFTSDDGNPISDFSIESSLTNMPVGWLSNADTFSCEQVSADTGCQLLLEYAPTAKGEGVLNLSYRYLDNSGTQKKGTVAIPYAARVKNTVQALPSQSIPFMATAGATARLELTFVTDDGEPVRWVDVVTDLDSLPLGWRAPNGHERCENVSSGNGCVLSLEYAPTVVEDGLFLVEFNWESGDGTIEHASFPIAYTAQKRSTVKGVVSPAGQIVTAVGGSHTVTVDFATTSGGVARDFALITDLAHLPAGWSSSASSLVCAELNGSSSSCQVELTHAPTVASASMFALAFSYIDNADEQRTGSTVISYSAVMENQPVITQSPSGVLRAAEGETVEVTFTVRSDDDQLLPFFSTQSGITAGGFETVGEAPFTCANVTQDGTCQFTLRWTANGSSGTRNLRYSYTTSAGTTKYGSIAIQYETLPDVLLALDLDLGVQRCVPDALGLSCTSAGLSSPYNGGITLVENEGKYAFLTNMLNQTITRCRVDAAGSFTECAVASSSVPVPFAIQYAYGNLYVSSVSGGPSLYVCPLTGVVINGCSPMPIAASLITDLVMSPAGLLALSQDSGVSAWACANPDPETGFLLCSPTGFTGGYVQSIAVTNTTAYIADSTNAVSVCTINSDTRSLENCAQVEVPLEHAVSVGLFKSRLYVTGHIGTAISCELAGEFGRELVNCAPANSMGAQLRKLLPL